MLVSPPKSLASRLREGATARRRHDGGRLVLQFCTLVDVWLCIVMEQELCRGVGEPAPYSPAGAVCDSSRSLLIALHVPLPVLTSSALCPVTDGVGINPSQTAGGLRRTHSGLWLGAAISSSNRICAGVCHFCAC